MAALVKFLGGTLLRRYVTGFIVTALLGGVALSWHNFKNNLREQGQSECIQQISRATVDALELALAKEQVANAQLRAEADATALANAEAQTRRLRAESKVTQLLRDRKQQEQNDETYAGWSNSPVPAGVVDRLRRLQDGAGSGTD